MSKIDKNKILKVAHAIDDAINNIKNPISSGSLIGVLNLTIDKAPNSPNESGREN